MKFELNTLSSYDDADLIAELQRVHTLIAPARLTAPVFDKHAKVHSSTVRKRFGGWAAALGRAGLKDAVSPWAQQMDRDRLVALVREVADTVGTKTLTQREFSKRTGLGLKLILARFESWRHVLAAAGLEQVPLGRRYTDAECFENVLALWAHYGRQPVFADLNKPPSTVGSKAYVRRWRGWRQALRAFIEHVEARDVSAVVPVEPDVEACALNENDAVAYVPRSINLSLRYAVLRRDSFRCVVCGRSPANTLGVELHVDHIVPWSRGGTSEMSNLRTLCSLCNLGKGAHVDA